MARGYFRTDERQCLFCGCRNEDNSPMPYKIGNRANKAFLCEKCFNKNSQSGQIVVKKHKN